MTPQPPDETKALFMNLVSMFSMSAMQHMGKLINPATGKAEQNLEAAQFNIDILDMLQARTKGNLDKQEERLLKDTVASMKMTYVETLNTTPKTESAAPAAKPETTAAKKDDPVPPVGPAPAAASAQPAAPNAPDEKNAKFHKSYGAN